MIEIYGDYYSFPNEADARSDETVAMLTQEMENIFNNSIKKRYPDAVIKERKVPIFGKQRPYKEMMYTAGWRMKVDTGEADTAKMPDDNFSFMVVSKALAKEIRKHPQFMNPEEYQDQVNLKTGEIGRVKSIRYICTT